MITYIYDLLTRVFFVSPGVALFLILITTISLVILAVYCVVLFLDCTYRPKSPQYPYNIFLDCVLPLSALFSPTTLIIGLNPENTNFLAKFFYIIVIHLFVLIPLMYSWSNHRSWSKNSVLLNSLWSNPKLYLDLSIAVIYPAIWGVYFSIARFLRINTDVYFFSSITNNIIMICLVLLFMGSFRGIWFRLILWSILDIQYYIWNRLLTVLHKIHIYFLKYNIYFIIMKYCYKISFIFMSFVCDNELTILKPRYYSWIKSVFAFLHKYNFILTLSILFVSLIELFFFKIKITLILLFVYPIMRAIFYVLFNFCSSKWVEDCCISDFITYNIKSPRYPREFCLFIIENQELLLNYPEPLQEI